MASLYMAQEVLICDRCNIAPVQKYCNKCDASLCDGCVAKHISLDKTKSHDIVTYELKTGDPKFPDCKIHAKNQCEMHCKECDNPVCVKCITSGSHQNHHFIEMLEIFKCDKDAMFQDTHFLETSLYPTIENAISELQTKLVELPKNHEKLLASISQLGAEWHREIDVVIEKRKEEAMKMKTRDLSTLQKLLTDLKNLLSDINRAILDNKQLLKSNKFSEIESYKSRVAEFKKSPTKFDVTPPTFTPLPIRKDQLEKMFGSLKSSSVSPHTEITSSTSSQTSTDSAKVRSDFHTGYRELYNIAFHSPDDIWVIGNEKNIKRFSHKGSLQQTITTKTDYPVGITVTLQGEPIYTDQGDNSIYIVRKGKPQKMITVQDWIPGRLCYTASGELLVGMCKDHQTPQKVVHCRGSTEKQVLQFDQNGKPWFSAGWRALFFYENRNGDLCASDLKAKQIVVINQVGKLRFRYTGNLSANKYTGFYPYGIATDSESQILVADCDNCIHIISEDGNFIRYIDNCGLSLPFDLSLDKNNTLYVTEYETAKVKTIEYIK